MAEQAYQRIQISEEPDGPPADSDPPAPDNEDSDDDGASDAWLLAARNESEAAAAEHEVRAGARLHTV